MERQSLIRTAQIRVADWQGYAAVTGRPGHVIGVAVYNREFGLDPFGHVLDHY